MSVTVSVGVGSAGRADRRSGSLLTDVHHRLGRVALVGAEPEDGPLVVAPETLVEERLAACVNRVACDSVYRWDGAVHDDPETVLFVKTSEAAVETVESRIVDLHPYEVPCVERFDEGSVYDPYAEWVRESVR